jgi:transcriptional regulator with XRE-family HTH domain
MSDASAMSKVPVMSEAQQFSIHIKHLRENRQWTLGKAALVSGISKSTLHTWESGRYTPRAPELKQYLEKLEPSPNEKIRLLKLLDAPRAMILLGVDRADRPPLSGDILRGLRLRQGKTQAEVALHLGVHQATLAKWEQSEDWPSSERLHSLCFYLGTTPEEAEAILSGVFLPEQTEGLATGDAIESIKAKLDAFEGDRYLSTSDLWFLSLESQVWWLARQSEAARELQHSIWFLHANYLINAHRWEEGSVYLQRVFGETERSKLPISRSQQSAFIIQAKIIALKDRNDINRLTKAEKAMRLLSKSESLMIDTECQAWYWMELASYMAVILRKEEALECSNRSNAIPHEDGKRLEGTEAKLATAAVALQTGKWNQAHTLLDEIVPLHVSEELSMLVIRTEIFLGTKEYDEAHAALQQFIKKGQKSAPSSALIRHVIERLTPKFP